MKKEELIALGLSEEQADKVIAGYGQMVPKSRLDDKIQENIDAKAKYESDLKETHLSSAIKLALHGKVHDADLATGLIDKTTIELDEDGNVTKGLDEQIKTLRESKAFLFTPETEDKPLPKGTKPGEGSKTGEETKVGDYGKLIAEERSKGTEGLDEARKSYFG